MASKTSDWRPGASVCRCCFSEGCYKDIATEYFWMGKREVYEEMLLETFNVNISFAQSSGPNSNSRLICEPCISRLRDAADFKKQVVDCEKVFQQHLSNPEGVIVEEIHLEDPEKGEEVKLERVKLESKVDDDDDGDFDPAGFPDGSDDDLDDQPLTAFASKVPKKEAVDFLEILESAKKEKRKSTTKVKASPAKKVKKSEPQPSASKAKPKPVPEKKKKELSEDKSLDDVKNNAKIILNYSTVYPHRLFGRGIKCWFCKNVYLDPNEYREHFDSAHKYFNKAKAMGPNFLLTRVDVSDIGCKECPKKFSTLEKLALHLKAEHCLSINVNASLGLVPIKLVKDLYQCVVCAQTFTGYYSLSRHSGEHFALHVCYICGQKVESQNKLELHMLGHKVSMRHYCKTCDKTFPSQYHKKRHYLQSYDCRSLVCKVCQKRFCSKQNLSNHQEKIHGIAKKHSICKYCGKNFSNRAMLHIHHKTTHTNDYQCQFCNATCWSATTLNSHIARKHTKEKPFSCKICGSSFFDQSNFKRHETIHDDSKKMPCHVCGRLFVRAHRLRDHVKRIHPEHVDDLI